MNGREQRIAAAAGKSVSRLSPLSGGCIGEVYRVAFADGDAAVAKIGRAGNDLALEGRMLEDLARLSDLPVPAVRHASDELLLMDYVQTGGGLDAPAQAHAAELLAALHGVEGEAFGYPYDTLIGGLHQPNPETDDWIGFFRDHRLLHMAGEALAAGRLDAATMARIETFAGRLDDWLPADSKPRLIHGDMWSGNVLADRGRIASFVDPAIYYADAEIELAFSTLFSTFGRPFFERYGEIRPLRPGFLEERRDIYNLYPLLTHVRLFGGHYVQAVGNILAKFGC